jgi:hypothetical protein
MLRASGARALCAAAVALAVAVVRRGAAGFDERESAEAAVFDISVAGGGGRTFLVVGAEGFNAGMWSPRSCRMS